jgi:AmmeMemoRadiSam system protein B
MLIRKPAFAGQFYPGNTVALKRQIEQLIDSKAVKRQVLGVILPHAGYIYSGPVAASVVSRLENYATYVILGPNHTGYGPAISVYQGEKWLTPLGEVSVNTGLAEALIKQDKVFEADALAHQFEHSIEVQLPIFQFCNQDFDIVPVVVGTSNLKILKQAGSSLAKVLKNQKSVLVVASSDMTHFESQESATQKDKQAIEAILKLDEDLLIQRVKDLDISMCGYGPAITMLACVKELGAKKAELIKYQTSGDVTGDYSAVVGYAGITVS